MMNLRIILFYDNNSLTILVRNTKAGVIKHPFIHERLSLCVIDATL